MKESCQKDFAWIALCSNIGDRADNLSKAIIDLMNLENVQVRNTSGLYRSEAVGKIFSGHFYNLVIGLETSLSPFDLQSACWQIESKYEFKNQLPNRSIDIDMLLFGSQVIDTAELTIPHPRLLDSRFVLEPLAEIAPTSIHPVAERMIGELLHDLLDRHHVEKLSFKLTIDKDR